jgi:hypothetical protein
LTQALPQLALQRTARFAQQAELAIHRAQIGVSHDVVGAQAQRALVAVDGRLELAVGIARRAEIVPRLGEAGIEAQRAPVRGDRVFQPAAILQHIAEIVVERGDRAVALDGLAQRRFGGFQAPRAPVRGAKNVQCVGRARRRGGGFARERFGFREAIERQAMTRAQDQFESHRAGL